MVWLLYVNDEEFNLEGFNDESISKQSKLLNNQFTETTPVWYNFQPQIQMVSDETQFVQFGFEVEREYLTYKEQLTPIYSAWNSFPTKDNPYALYKYASLEVNLSKDMV